jgi:hypothetical protein
MTYRDIAQRLRGIADELEKRGPDRSISGSFLLVCQPSTTFLISTDSADGKGKIEETF